jgi:hypothetical protein
VSTYRIAAHPIQRGILGLAIAGKLDGLSLRAIAKALRLPNESPQQVKHHLTQMVKYGFLDVVGGKYRVGSILRMKQ